MSMRPVGRRLGRPRCPACRPIGYKLHFGWGILIGLGLEKLGGGRGYVYGARVQNL
jgi:hypothetical protein